MNYASAKCGEVRGMSPFFCACPITTVFKCVSTLYKTHHASISKLAAHLRSIIIDLTLILLTWTIWRAPTNARKWRMGFNTAFKGLMKDRD